MKATQAKEKEKEKAKQRKKREEEESDSDQPIKKTAREEFMRDLEGRFPGLKEKVEAEEAAERKKKEENERTKKSEKRHTRGQTPAAKGRTGENKARTES